MNRTRLGIAMAAVAAAVGAVAVAQNSPPPGAMAMKTVICRVVPRSNPSQVEANGDVRQERLAIAIEQDAAVAAKAGYVLAGLIPGGPGAPAIACYRSLADSSKLPLGAR